jgi:protein-S-isoprenylcysteine O-methyltransferase Ste14
MAFLLAKYFIFSATIVGCLFGYGHSILGYLWGKKIHNLDFTLMGWATNALCYGPLLGFILWKMVPPYVAADPGVTTGPLYYMAMVMGLLLNLFYMLTIWNMGKMFGVMTDKGVRTSAFYSVVRHPSYTLEAAMLVVLSLGGLATAVNWLAVSTWIVIYCIRSEREDNFMSNSNPDYLTYKANTPFKFIPGVY